MKEKDVVRAAMNKSGVTQVELQKALNLKSQSVSVRISKATL